MSSLPPLAARSPTPGPTPAPSRPAGDEAAKPSANAAPKVEIRGEHTISADVIEVEELVQFRDRLEQITRELVDEYSRIIAMRRPSRPE
ncbi:MAG: hypothetical protein ACYCU0_13490 [Solirubrobacteraceae bacterium]